MTDPQTPGITIAAFADVLMALASLALAVAIARFARRRPDLARGPLPIVAIAFAAAIAIVHALAAAAAWHPLPAVEGTAKALAALVAIALAAGAWRTMPRALALPNPADLVREKAALSRELDDAARAQHDLRESCLAAERSVEEHQRALAETAARLEREVADHRRTDQSLRYNETLLRRLHDGLEEHISERTAELTKTISELEAFSYSISHDLRAPLRAINGYAAILGAEHASALDDDGRALLARIETNAARMAQLIDGLLEVVSADVDMRELATAAAAEVTGGADAASAALEVSELPRARGDAQMLRQVWVNLIANALKFSAPKPKPRVMIGGERRGDEIVYWVRDNGVGFDMKYAEKLFGVFHRLHRAEEFPGVGVGLAIVRRIVVRHGGRVWAESAPGEGSTFYFTVNASAGNG
jgi:signal transduction histidine kinase